MRHFLLISCLIVTGVLAAQNRFSKDKVLRDLYTQQDHRNTAGLLPYLSHKKEKYRLAAAMAFASVQDTSVSEALQKLLSADKSNDVRQAAAYSLGQLRRSWLLAPLKAEYALQQHTAVKNTILEAIGKCADASAVTFFEGIDVKSSLYEGYVRGVYFATRRKVKSDIIEEKIKTISADNPGPALLHLCTRILSVPKPEEPKPASMKTSLGIDAVKDTLKTLKNPYQQVAFLKRYSVFPEDLYQLTLNDYALVVKTYCMESYFEGARKVQKTRMLYILNSGNMAFISLACERIRKDTVSHLADSIPVNVLGYVADHLDLPRELETWIDLQRTIAFIKKGTYVYQSPEFQHPIDWDIVKSIPKGQKVRVTTTKGTVILQCKVDDAPGSVANFLQLVDTGYYNGKYFHRMVPEFVVQGGCPRGDGWGSLDWTQRSEFSNWLRYKPGSTGLASAGKDSEGVQFFITHTYTSQLDGRYTIFAEVVEGMDIVNQLVVGDQIIRIERI
jgi:cyclophilin family peptidyl-prolyl cis-trans isomerase